VPLDTLVSAKEGTEDTLALSEEETSTPSDNSTQAPEESEEDESSDVLLLETGRILVDAIAMRPDTSVAGRAHNTGNKAL
jgi:hypothetical protein